jgi:hypothetical protein
MKGDKMKISPVKVLGQEVGNRWNVLDASRLLAVVTYEGNSLIFIKKYDKLLTVKEIEELINNYYGV